MKLRWENTEEWKARISQWHRFFAIWPRQVGPKEARLFETLERRAVNIYVFDDAWAVDWEYRSLGE
jgi:hypothetical protein